MALITTIILYLNEKFEEDGDMDNRSSNNEPFSQFNAMETTDLQIPIVISKNDEHLTSFCGHLNSVLPKIFSFIPKSSKVIYL
jgi:hypothetical protein